MGTLGINIHFLYFMVPHRLYFRTNPQGFHLHFEL